MSHDETQCHDEKEESPHKNVAPFISLFKYASLGDKLLILSGILCAIMCGLCIPVSQLFNGGLATAFICYEILNNNQHIVLQNGTRNESTIATFCIDANVERIMAQIRICTISIGSLSVVRVLAGYIMMTTLTISSENQVFRIRCLFLKSFLRQNVEWFDNQNAAEFGSRAVDDLQRYKEGISCSLGFVIIYLSTFFGSAIMALITGWKLALVTLTFLPLAIINEIIIAKLQSSYLQMAMTLSVKAANSAEETLSLIRTVSAYGGESREFSRYNAILKDSQRMAIKSGVIRGIGMAIGLFLHLAFYGLSFWYGIKLIVADRDSAHPDYTSAKLATVVASMMVSSIYLSLLPPHLEVIQNARAAIIYPFQVIARTPSIDSASLNGSKPNNLTTNIIFEDVFFNYPSRPDVQVLKGFNLEIPHGATVALVGRSGCGKSTTVQLLQRFYNPTKGTIKIGGIEISEINLGWLRDRIGVVGQEPVLFEASILENVRFGNRKSTAEDIMKACKEANAHNFIVQLPQKYNTVVGGNGAQLSGGQKQRIAIARALIRDPKILILDEATSALDSESELIVQQALDKAAKGRTTIIIAHRLTTVCNADRIVVIEEGTVVEMGTHNELMQMEGIYHGLVTNQIDARNISKGHLNQMDSRDENVSHNDMHVSSTRRVNSLRSIRRDSETYLNNGLDKTMVKNNRCNLKLKTPSLLWLLKVNFPEWIFLLVGCIGTILGGCMPVVYSVLYGMVFGVISYPDPNEIIHFAGIVALIFLALAAAAGLGKFLQHTFFCISGEKLTTRLRQKTFSSMLRQEMSWFDEPENAAGILSSRIANDASSVQWAAKMIADAFLQSAVTLLLSMLLSIVLNWKLGLAAGSLFPLAVIATVLHSKAVESAAHVARDSMQSANKIAVEAIVNLRTVASLHMENAVYSVYCSLLEGPHKKSKMVSHRTGILFGFSQSIVYIVIPIIIHFGTQLMLRNEISYRTIVITNQLYVCGFYKIGEMVMFSTKLKETLIASAHIRQIWQRNSKIDSFNKDGIHLKYQICNGQQEVQEEQDKKFNIMFNNISFHYPTRTEALILQKFTLEIAAGKCTAIVGSSGCGKSTCIQLLERFYDPEQGEVVVNGIDIRKINIGSLRSCIGIVSQEPMLFDRSIVENITFGDNRRDIPMCEVIDAARKANIHEFISSLPEGYYTNVGRKGVQLSGGQKQRIAIARALIRNPQILLLDEATSALDANSEMIVQKILEEAQKGRTCITIAHRLSTIQNADQIVVLYQGKVAEMGTHDDLMQLKGRYYKLHNSCDVA